MGEATAVGSQKTGDPGVIDLDHGNTLLDQDPQCPAHTTERKLMAKIDLHVLPCLCILYLMAFLDR